MENKELQDEHYFVPELKELGFTEGAIKRFLGNPDTTIPSKVYPSKKVRLFECSRVDKVMRSREFKSWQKSYERGVLKRSKSRLKAVKDKSNEVLARFKAYDVALPNVSYDELIKSSDAFFFDDKNAFLQKDEFRLKTFLIYSNPNVDRRKAAYAFLFQKYSRCQGLYEDFGGKPGFKSVMKSYRLHFARAIISKWKEFKFVNQEAIAAQMKE